MECPHCNNSNNICIADAGLRNHPAHMPNKNKCNGVSENGCSHLDAGYGSIELGKCEERTGLFQKQVSAPIGPVLKKHYPSMDPLQSPQQNGPKPQLTEWTSTEAVNEYETDPNDLSSSHRSQNVDAVQCHFQNGNLTSPMGCLGHSNSFPEEDTSTELDSYGPPLTPIHNGHPLTPKSQNEVENGPTSQRYPPVIRKHSSFLRQNAIEEEEDDVRDELNDSGFGSMLRMNSREQPRRSRSQDVSDAPAEDVNNNLCPKKLHRSHSSTEKTDNELEQFRGEKRRCSSEQLQRSNGSSGYYSGGNIEVDVPAGEESRHEDLREASEEAVLSTAASEHGDDVEGTILNILGGLQDRHESWSVPQLHEEFLCDPAVQPILTVEDLHCQLLRNLSRDVNLDRLMQEINIPVSDMICHSNGNNGYENAKELRSTTCKTQEGLSDDLSTGKILISKSEGQQGTDHISNAQHQHVPDIVKDQHASHLYHGDTMDAATREELQTILERRAYCEATCTCMEHNKCRDLECLKARVYQINLKECYDRRSLLEKCTDCRRMVQAYWNHSLSCKMEKCLLPFCDYFKELRSETGVLCDPGARSFHGALACLIKQEEIEVLQRLHELQQLQRPAADGDRTWSANANAESYLRRGLPDSNLTPVERQCKFGRFTPIRCDATRSKTAGKFTVSIKKLKISEDLASTLQLLHRHADQDHCDSDQDLFHSNHGHHDSDQDHRLLRDLISTCLWYRQIQGEKLLVCSTFLTGEKLSSCTGAMKNKKEDYWMQACNAAVKLHELGILYLNWKADHLIVTEGDRVKLCNFAYAVDIRQCNRDLRGSCSEDGREFKVPDRVKTGLDPRIAPPEVIDERGLTRYSDSWGLGCLLYQLYNGFCLPYHQHLRHSSDNDIRKERLKAEHALLELPKNKWYTEACFSKNQHERKLAGELPNCLQRFRTYHNRANGYRK